MIRLAFGFVLGVIFTFYSYPFVHGVLTQFGIIEEKPLGPYETSEPAYTLNPNPPVSLVREQKYESSQKETDRLNRIMKAVSLSRSAPETAKAPDFVLNVISEFVQAQPHLGAYVRDRINDGDGLNNREALEIMNKYVSQR